MLKKYLLILGMFAVSAASTPTLLSDIINNSNDTTSNTSQKDTPQLRSPQRKRAIKISAKQTSHGKSTKITSDTRGHFIVSARLNGKKNNVLVDTGATYVAINESTAKKLGIKLTKKDFKYKMNTANGVAYAAGAVIDEIKIGKIRVNNVQATVMRDKSLQITLLGMSFLNKLDKFVIEGNTLTLVE